MVSAMILSITIVDAAERPKKSRDYKTTGGASNLARMSLGDKTLDLEIAQHVLLREHADLG